MKRKILSLILVFAMTVSLLTVGTGAVEPAYGDTAGHWAESSIERWSAYGIIQGSNGQFDPNGQLTCAQLATILAKLLKLPAAKDAGFTDNTADAWYYDAINRCAAAGILNGNGDGTVTPEAPISRERAMVMLARALGIEPISNPDLTKYADAAQVSAYAQGYVAALIEAGIVGGVTADQLAPQANINRASTVTILDRAISTYADEAGATVKADGKGIVLVVAENVKITGAPEGTKIVVADGATGLTVNGKSVSDDQTYIVPKTEPAKPSSSSSGGSVHTHAYTTFVTNWNDMTTVRKCSCGATQTIENSNTYYIANDTDLKAFRNKVNAGEAFEGKTIELTKDISLAEEWAPIGNGSRSGSTYTGNAFKGIFDGKGKSISNVKITANTTDADDAIGLFGVVDDGTVKNVTLNVNINVVNNKLAGGAIGLLVNGGTAEKIHVTGNVKAADGVGGIVGRMLISGTIKECVNEAVVDAAKAGSGSGGIVGKAYYTATGKTMNIQDCENRGSITAAYCAGGIAGLSAANVSGCTNSGSVTAGNHAGGIVGEQTNYGAVSGNTNSAAVIGKTTAAGGIIGWVRYQTDESAYPNTALITVTGNTNSGSIGKKYGAGNLGYGGIVGTLYNQGTVSGNTNNAPTITGGTFAAGIVGGPQIANDNKRIDGTVVTITNNVTTTTLDNISGTNKDLIAWKNDGSFVIDNNSGTGWTVKIGEAQYTNLAAALAAAKDGDTVKLVSDTTLTSSVEINKSITLDLNDKTIHYTGENQKTANPTMSHRALNVTGGTVTIKSGFITTTVAGTDYPTEFDAVVVKSGADVTLKDMNITINDAKGSCLYVFEDGKATVKSGSYTNTNTSGEQLLLNQKDNKPQAIFVEGGTFNGRNPANGDNSDNPSTFLAEGYEAVKNEGKWTVKPIFAGGTGTAEDPFVIQNAEQLKAFRDNVNAGNTFAGKTIELMDNIDLSSVENWVPIGNESGKAFAGTFDGNNKTISNLKITAGNYAGLFGYVSTATIKDVKLAKADVSGGERMATLIGKITGNATVTNCSNDAASSVTGSDSNTGGLIGEIVNGTVELTNLVNNAAVKNTKESNSRAGGVVAQVTTGANVTLTNCTNNGAVKTNNGYAGGIVSAYQSGTLNIANCVNKGTLDGAYEGNMLGWYTSIRSITISSDTNEFDINAIGCIDIAISSDMSLYGKHYFVNRKADLTDVSDTAQTFSEVFAEGEIGTSPKELWDKLIAFYKFAAETNSNFEGYPKDYWSMFNQLVGYSEPDWDTYLNGYNAKCEEDGRTADKLTKKEFNHATWREKIVYLAP